MGLFAVQTLSRVCLFATPWAAAHQASCPSPSPPELAPTHVHGAHDAIQPPRPLSALLLQSFPASGSLLTSWLFASGGVPKEGHKGPGRRGRDEKSESGGSARAGALAGLSAGDG